MGEELAHMPQKAHERESSDHCGDASNDGSVAIKNLSRGQPNPLPDGDNESVQHCSRTKNEHQCDVCKEYFDHLVSFKGTRVFQG